MKNNFKQIIAILFLAFVSPFLGMAQGNSIIDLDYDVKKIYPYISISKGALQEAKTLSDFRNETNDINVEYNDAWVKEYLSVEMSACHDGEIVTIQSKSNELTSAHRALIAKADEGTSIAIKIAYIPENTLSHNEPQEMDFSFTINPDQDAQYPGGQAQMKRYLKKAIDQLPSGSFEGYDLAAIKFVVNEAGQVADANVLNEFYPATRDKSVDQLLLQTIKAMPNWQPAQYADGTHVAQEFVLTVGNLENCMVHTLNIKQNLNE